MNRWVGPGLGALLLAACHAPLRPSAPAGAPGPAPGSAPVPGPSLEDLAAAVAADARQADRASDANARASLADEAQRNADACLERAPEAAACLYYHAVALGLQARAHPARAGELLKRMLDALSRADAADPEYDEAGPARVRALVLARAPAWPLGPGDPDAAVAAARRAISLRPQFPPNVLALGEALMRSGDARGAEDCYARARDLALEQPAAPDRDDWLREAEQGLRRDKPR